MTPKLSVGNEVLHKDRRFIVFRVSKESPFEGYEPDCSVLVYDRLYGSALGFVDDSLSGICNPSTYQNSLPICGNSAAELVHSVRQALKTLRSCK